MKIKQNKRVLEVTIFNDSNMFYYFQSLIEKNFYHKIGKRERIVIFNNKDELIQKRYFLKLLSRIYAKVTKKKKKKIWQVEKAVNKTIKIRLLKERQLKNIVHIDIDFNKDEGFVIFKLDQKNRVVTRGIKNIFKNYKVQFNPSINSITISSIDNNFLPLFEDFISIGEVFDNYIKFDYKIGIFFDIEEFIKKRRKPRKGVKVILEEFYELLNCNLDDSYEKVRKSYLELAKKYHPDRLSVDNKIILNIYSKKFQKIQKAYETIREYHKFSDKVA